MDWFEQLTGFPESSYAQVQASLEVRGTTLHSNVNGAAWGIGTLELVSLQALRERVAGRPALLGRLKVSIVRGDARQLHRLPENAGALFQVASQFNLLEMLDENVTPEQGVTRYASDPTQGPACAIAAGAATIYRNYFAPVDGQVGQTSGRQIDALAPLGAALAQATGLPVEALWTMRNGYALCTRSGVDAIDNCLAGLDEAGRDRLRGRLCIGLHHDVEVTDAPQADGGTSRRPLVSQAFCSALPVSYARRAAGARWQAFATLVLEAAYEATFRAALARAQAGGSRRLLLTLIGGGVFGNPEPWVLAAMGRAMHLFKESPLDVQVVSFREPSPELRDVIAAFR